MATIHEQYTHEMYEKFGYFACWLPSMPLALGDVGTFTGRRFDKFTSLAELGVDFATDPPGNRADLEYSSNGAVTVTTDVEAGLVKSNPLVSLSITFAREGATFVQAVECVEQTISDLPRLEASLLTLCRSRTWRPKWSVITRLISTGPTAILISNDRDARIDLKLSANGLGTALPVANATGDLMVTARSGLAAQVLSPDGATPLFRVSQMRRKAFGGQELVIRDALPDEPALELALVAWHDLTAE